MYCNIDASDHSTSSPTHHSVKHLNQMFLLFSPHALGGNCYRSIWASFLMTWLTGNHLQEHWLRVYHSLSFQVATCPKASTRQIKHEFHQAKVSKVWSLLYSIWEFTNVVSKGTKCIAYEGSPMQGCSAKHFPTFTGALVTLGAKFSLFRNLHLAIAF